MENSNLEVPVGYMKNAQGHLVHESNVRDQDKLRDSIVLALVKEATDVNEALKAFKDRALNDIADLVSIAAEKYDVKLGGKKGNVSLTSYDGKYKIQRNIADVITFTEELEAAKALITECINTWSEESNENLRTIVNSAFKTNTNGQVKTAEILKLMRYEIKDNENGDWKRAMEALKDSIQVNSTSTYIRVYERIGMSDQYKAIPLDIAAVHVE